MEWKSNLRTSKVSLILLRTFIGITNKKEICFSVKLMTFEMKLEIMSKNTIAQLKDSTKYAKTIRQSNSKYKMPLLLMTKEKSHSNKFS